MSSEQTFDSEAFRAFELEGWERLGTGYQRYWAEMTLQAADPLLGGTNVTKGSRVLDVATGPGNIARAAVERGAEVTGVDFSETVLELARRACPDATFKQADAEALPFPDAGFDAVVVNFGILHFPNPEKALSEAHRVLRPGGKLGFTNWLTPGETGIGIAMRAVNEHGTVDVGLPVGTDMFRFADAGECKRVLSKIGFDEVTSGEIPLTWRFDTPDDLIVGFMEAAPRSGSLLNAQTPVALRKIREAMWQAALNYERNGMIEIPMPAVLTTATRA